MDEKQLKMTIEQERELCSLKNRLYGDRLGIFNFGNEVIVDDFSTNRRFTIYSDGEVFSEEIPKPELGWFGKLVLIMVPVYGILFFSLGEDFMIPIFILGVINLFMAGGIIF